MRILHVISTLKMGGAEHLMVDLLPALRRLGNDVELLLINGANTPFYRELIAKNILIHHIQEQGKIYSLCHVLKARKYINQYDIIHTHTFPCQMMIACAKQLLKSNSHLVTTEHSTNNHRRDKIFLRPIDIWMYRQYEAKICIAQQSRDKLVKHLRTDKGVLIINNGIDYTKYHNPIKENLPHIKTITMVASMRDAKDQDTLIKSMSLLDDSYRLQLIGDGPRRTTLEILVKELKLSNKVVFMGNQSDIPSILKNSDIIVLSSHWEGLSLASIEGMASGRPFIASDVPGLGSIVKNYGEIFPVGDYEALAKIINKICSNIAMYKEVAVRCQNRAKQFDINVTAERYNALYKQLVNKK